MLEILLHGLIPGSGAEVQLRPPSRVMPRTPLSLPVQISSAECGEGWIDTIVP